MYYSNCIFFKYQDQFQASEAISNMIPNERHCRFEEKSEVMEQLDHQLRRLHSSTEALFEYRRALANSTGSLSRWEKYK